MKPEEKRRFPRRTFNRKVGLLAQGAYQTCEAYEIGEGGMLLGHPELFCEVGYCVILSFQVPGGEFISVRGVLVYKMKDKNIFGVEFKQIPFSAKKLIRTLVASKTAGDKEDLERRLEAA